LRTPAAAHAGQAMMGERRTMTSDGKPGEVDTALSDEAIDWMVKLHSGRATTDDRAAFAAWRRTSNEHERAAGEAETIWHGLGKAGDQVRREERKTKLTRRAILGAGMLMAGGVALERSGAIGPHLFADHVTGIGEQRSIGLPDGSSAFLSADTALSVDFSATERRLRLFRGEAIFTVAHDAGRAFLVETRDGRTRAIGTVFDVDIRPIEVVVTVLEGAVDIATSAEPFGTVIARADQRVRYGARGRPTAPETVDSDVETAWRRGKLIFDRRPLGDVVAEIERHRSGRIMIASDRLRSLEVTGVFDLAEPESVLRTIEMTLPVRVTRLPLVTIIR
jgi:transmembrane sensor